MGTAAGAAGVAVVIVPRERFSFVERSLESVLAHTTHPHELIYVDGRSPARVGRYLKARAASADFRLIRTPHHLTPNEARNIGWRATSARYVVFVDNDVLVTPGWLEALVACADETGAWLVGPTSCIGEPTATLVHMAGGQAKIAVKDGRRVLVDEHGFENRRLDAVRSQMHRKPTGLIEFHTALVRREVFDRLGPLDEALRSTREHIDLSLAVQQAGGEIWFEPASVVTYVPPPPFRWFDVPYFLVRWSEAWNTASLQHFRKKWELGDDDPALLVQNEWLRRHRHIILAPLTSLVSRLFGEAWGERLLRRVLAPAEVLVNRLAVSGRKR